jgi:hypothetical protein
VVNNESDPGDAANVPGSDTGRKRLPMHEHPTPAIPEAATLNQADRLNFALAAIVIQAGQLAKGSPARAALARAAKPILSALDELDVSAAQQLNSAPH